MNKTAISLARYVLKIITCVLIVCVINLFVPFRLLPSFTSAQTSPPEPTYLFSENHASMPETFTVLDRDLSKTASFNSSAPGFNYWFEDQPENVGIVYRTDLNNNSITLIENDSLKPAEDGSPRNNISFRVSGPDPNGGQRQVMVSGILEDGGSARDSKLIGQLSQLNGTPIKNITITIPKNQVERVRADSAAGSVEYVIFIVIGLAILAAVAASAWCHNINTMCIENCANACPYGVRRVSSWCGLQCACECRDRPQGGGSTPIQN